MDGRTFSGLHWPEDGPEWCGRVMRDHAMWTEYGAGFDLRDLPAREYQAHAALIAGMMRRDAEDAEKANREAKTKPRR